MPQQENSDRPEHTELVVMTSDGAELTPEQLAVLKAQIRESGGIDPFDRRLRFGEEYRTSLYALLTKIHPKVFSDDADPMHRQENADLIMDFLRKQLQHDGIQVNEKVFGMLYLDFISSRQFHLMGLTLKEKN
jgi:hypothetical protein